MAAPYPKTREARALDQKPERMRGILAAAAVLAAVLAGFLAWSSFSAAVESQRGLVQQQNLSGPMMSASSSRERADTFVLSATQTEVPNLASLLGMTREQAVSAIGHGAAVADERPADSSAHGVRTVLTLPLTAERSDRQAGAPTVYLGLDEAQRVCTARYSVAMESLGYSGELTFRQAVQRMHVVERTLADAGVAVEEGAAQLPASRSEYATFREDGRTIAREYTTFGGEVDLDGYPAEWSASLDYDYATAIETGNLADATHIIAVGVASLA